MPLVNLIQEQRLGIRQRERQGRMVLMAIFGIGAFSFLTAGYFTFETVRFTLKSNELRAKKERLQPTMAELESNNQTISTLQVKMDTLTSAEKSTVRWSGLLAYLGANTPDGVWLSDLKSGQADPRGPVSVAVTGLSVDQEKVGQFILRLEAAKELQNVILKYTQEKVGFNMKSTQFELSAGMEGTAPDQVVATEGEVKS